MAAGPFSLGCCHARPRPLDRPRPGLSPRVRPHPGTYTVGRALGADIRLDDLSVSRRHAALVVEAAAAEVRDFGSRNGTYLGDARVAAAPLGDAATVAFGSVACEFDWGGEWHDPSTATMAAQGSTGPAVSPAERRVLELLVGGQAEKDIAARLGLSSHTVHTHVKRLYRAYGVHTRAQLLAAVFGPAAGADGRESPEGRS